MPPHTPKSLQGGLRRALTGALAGAALLTSPALAQQRAFRVMVLYDMEGITGAASYRQTAAVHTDEYGIGRRSLTDDVNAAIAGLRAAGAGEILVVDGHGSGNDSTPDVLVDQLQAPARMQYRDAPFDIYMDSYDRTIDAIVAVGMHAGAGNPVGFLSHTYTGEDIDYRVNGVPFNETMILAAGAARLGIPVIMVSGDDQLEREVRRELPWVRYAAVKHAVDRTRAEPLPREEASRRIETAAREALLHLADARLPSWTGPYRFALTFQDGGQARAAALVPGTDLQRNGTTVWLRAGDFEEGYRRSTWMMSLASTLGELSAWMAAAAARPDSQALTIAQVDAWYARFLGTAPATTGAPARRYWGAR